MEFNQIPRGVDESPRERAYMNPRLWIMGALLAVVVVVGIIIVMRRADSSGPSQVDQVGEVIRTTCDGEACALTTALAAAKSARDSQICQAITENESASECTWQYAYDMSDPTACTSLVGELRESCVSNAYYRMASEGGDITLCEQIGSGELKETCINELMPSYIAANRCAEAGSAKEACELGRSEWTVFAERIGAALCTPFSQGEEGEDSAEHVLCSQVIDTIDLDGDGLVIREEIERGTDNKNKDSDGDGFDDGTEVAGGYNPLGI